MPAKPTDDVDQGALNVDPLHGLDDAVLAALAIVSCPHWLPASTILRTFRDDLLPALPELIRLGLVRVTASGALTVPGALRDRMLSETFDRHTMKAISAKLIPVFEQGNAESQIESCYHRLAVDPLDGSRRMFALALSLVSEPAFAFAQLQRLIEVWREFESRWGLEEAAAAYLRFSELFRPTRRKPLKEELKILKELQRPDDPLFQARIEMRIGQLLTALNEIDEAHAALQRAYTMFVSIGNMSGRIQADRALARLAIKIDRFDEARACHERALSLSRELGHMVSVAQSLQGLAEIDSLSGNLDRARKRYEEAIALLVDEGGRTAEAHTRILFSQLLTMRGELDAASAHIARATQVYQMIDNKLGRANGLRIAALVDLEAGRLESARERNRAAATAYAELGTSTGIAACKETDAQIEMVQGDLAAASSLLQEAQSIFEKAGDRFGAANCLRDQGALALMSDDGSLALDLLIRSAKQFEEIGAQLESNLALALASAVEPSPDGYAARQILIEAGVELPRAYSKSWELASRDGPVGSRWPSIT